MQRRGEQEQARNAFICLGVAAASAIAILTGAWDMNRLGYETVSTAARIGLGLFLLIMSLAGLVLFIWGYRVVKALRTGRTRFQGWRVSPTDYDRFRAGDAAIAATYGLNDYPALRVTPPEGVEVAYSRDGVLVGGRYFGLASTGLQRFHSVAMIRSDPSMLQFGITTTSANRFGFRLFHSILRVPLSSDGLTQAEAVLAHYQAVLRGEVIVHPNFWKLRVRIGLVTAALSAAAIATGVLLDDFNAQLNDAPEIMVVVGIMFGLGGLILAFAAWRMDRSRRPARRRGVR